MGEGVLGSGWRWVGSGWRCVGEWVEVGGEWVEVGCGGGVWSGWRVGGEWVEVCWEVDGSGWGMDGKVSGWESGMVKLSE